MIAPELFNTQRLQIRRLMPSDAESIYHAYASNEKSVRYISWKKHESVLDTKVFLTMAVQNFDNGKDYAYALILKETNELIGSIGMVNEGGRVFIGYIMSEQHEGKGYTTEAAQKIVDYLCQEQGIFKIWACCATENVASIKVLEKTGMVREATIRDWLLFPNLNNEPRDCHFYFYPKNE